MSSVSKNTNLVIYNVEKKSSKLIKAENLNINTMHFIEFKNKYKIDI